MTLKSLQDLFVLNIWKINNMMNEINDFKVILKDALFNTIGEGVVSLKKTYGYLNGVEINASVEGSKLEHPLAIIDKWKDVPIKNRLILNEIQHLFIELFAKSRNISVKNAELFVSYVVFGIGESYESKCKIPGRNL